MKTLKIVYSVAIALATILVVYIYGLNFNTLDENTMVSSSFIWVSLVVFGTSGFLTLNKKRSLLLSILWGIFSMTMLFLFFGIIWPKL